VPGAESILRGALGVETALAEVAERLGRVTVQVRAGGRSAGAGVVWLRNGVVIKTVGGTRTYCPGQHSTEQETVR